MKNRTFFFGTLFGTALFIYLISSFLIATFDITLWENYHRFFAVVAYWFLVTTLLDKTPTTKAGKVDKTVEPTVQKDTTLEEKELEPGTSHASQIW